MTKYDQLCPPLFSRSGTTRFKHGGSLVDSMPFVISVAGSKPALAAIYGPRASPSLTVVRFHAVSGAPLSGSGLEEAL